MLSIPQCILCEDNKTIIYKQEDDIFNDCWAECLICKCLYQFQYNDRFTNKKNNMKCVMCKYL